MTDEGKFILGLWRGSEDKFYLQNTAGQFYTVGSHCYESKILSVLTLHSDFTKLKELASKVTDCSR